MTRPRWFRGALADARRELDGRDYWLTAIGIAVIADGRIWREVRL